MELSIHQIIYGFYIDIIDEDFINDNYSLRGTGNSKGIKNAGKIRIGGGGHAALLGDMYQILV